MVATSSDPTNFFDGAKGYPSTMRIVLNRSFETTTERWFITTPIGYRDSKLGDIVVPERDGAGETDLTSVPQLMTWLVPKTGAHLPAALIHDGLTPPHKRTYEIVNPKDPTHELTQVDADRVFRDAMRDLQTPTVRRWLVWSAVSIPTVWTTGKLRAILAYASIVAIVVLGWLATLDLFDQVEALPWMNAWLPGNATPWNRELIGGALGAVVIPPILAFAFWPRLLRSAGVIVGMGIAALLHVTVAVGAITVAYQFVEQKGRIWTSPKPAIRRLKVGGSIIVMLWIALTWWLCARR